MVGHGGGQLRGGNLAVRHGVEGRGVGRWGAGTRSRIRRRRCRRDTWLVLGMLDEALLVEGLLVVVGLWSGCGWSADEGMMRTTEWDVKVDINNS